MKLTECRKCQYYISSIQDRIVCSHNSFKEYKIINDIIENCPLENTNIIKCSICNQTNDSENQCPFCKFSKDDICNTKIIIENNNCKIKISNTTIEFDDISLINSLKYILSVKNQC